MKYFLWMLLTVEIFFGSCLAFAAENNSMEKAGKEEVDPHLRRYVKQAEKAAEKMEKNFEYYSAPFFAEIYNSYLNDVSTIAQTGTAPDNSFLYKDLEMMDSAKLQLFYQNKKAAFEK